MAYSDFTTNDQLASIYVGYFGRAAEPEGLTYWNSDYTTIYDANVAAGQSAEEAELNALIEIATSFSNNTETTNMYTFLADPATGDAGAFVDAVYDNLFGRTPDAEGKAYWVAELTANIDDPLYVGKFILTVQNAAGSIAEGETGYQQSQDDQTTLANRAEVSAYYAAQVTAQGAEWTTADDLADAQSVLTGVTNEAATVTTAKADADTLIAADLAVPGETFTLTAGTDRGADFEGTSDNDTFDAPMVQNEFAGGVSNSLSSADELDGGAGTDVLNAELVDEFVGATTGYNVDVQPRTTSIEDINIEARDYAGDDAAEANGNVVTLDAKHMTGIDEIGSSYSDGDLVIENLTTLTDGGSARNTSDLTITMDHTDNFNTDGDASDLEVYFDEDYLLNDEDTSGAQLEIRLLNAVQNEAGNNPVEGFSEIAFSVGGTAVTVDITSIADDGTLDYTTAYDQVVDAINEQLAADGFDDVTASRAPIEDAVFSIPVAGFSTGDDAGDYYPIIVTNTGSEELVGTTISTSALKYDTDMNNSFQASDPETTENPVSVNVELEKVGRDAEGGDLVIGGKSNDVFGDTDVDQVDGIELFNISVFGGEDKPSNLGQISSTNQYLNTVNIESVEPGKNSDGEDTWADLTVRDQLGEGQELTLIDATDFEGDFSLAQNGVQQVVTANFGGGNDYMNWTSVEADGLPAGTGYSLSMGAGNDTLDANLDGDSVDAFGETFKVSMGSGDDTLNITMDATDGVSQQTMADLHNKPGDYLEIETGAGEDTVNLAAYGNFNIETDSGSDFVRINSEAGKGNGDANTGVWVFGPATSGADTFGDRVLYKAQLTVSFAGFESTVAVDTDSQGNFVADQMTINAAIIAAIEDNDVPELDTLLKCTLGTDSQQLTITSLVGGENDLAIALYQPEVVASDADDDDVTAGQVKVSSGDLTALRQGLIDTTADTSADLEEESDIIAAIDNGSIDQDGDGDGVTYDYITNDTVLDGVDDGNAAPDQDIFDLAGGDLYQDYDAGGSDDSTTGVNFSTIDVGDGSNDIVVMHSNHGASSNVLKISDAFGKVSVVNFHNVPTDEVNSYTDVSTHALDFTTYLTNQDDPSDVPAGNTQSVVPVPLTLNIVDTAEAFSDSAANPDATNTNDAIANGVNVLRFDENVADTADLQTFEDLTAEILKDALNDSDDDGSTDYGNLDQDLLTPDDFGGNDLQSTTQRHIVMVENDQNEGEYKVFALTSSVDADGDVDEESDGGVHQFATAEELGTLDFGASINFNLVGSDEYKTDLAELLAVADGDEPVEPANTAPVVVDGQTFTVDENSAAGTTVGTVSASDADTDTLSYVLSDTSTFVIDSETGVLTVADGAVLDFETTESYTINVIVSDAEDFDTAVLTVDINDVDENGGAGFTPESADIGTPTVPEALNAIADSFKFTDDATVQNNVVISNFTTDDVIEVTNALETDYHFTNNGADVAISFNNAGTLNQIVLSGVVTAGDLVHDQASFETAIGFDAFTVA